MSLSVHWYDLIDGSPHYGDIVSVSIIHHFVMLPVCCVLHVLLSIDSMVMLLLARLINRQDVVFDEWRKFGSFGCRQCR